MNPVDTIKKTMTATRIHFSWYNTNKKVPNHVNHDMAKSIQANPTRITARQKLIDTTHTAWQDLTALKSAIIANWKAHTTPYPEDAIRLIRQDDLANFNNYMQQSAMTLRQHAEAFQAAFDSVKAKAKEDLGQAFVDANYPDNVAQCFAVFWDFPSLAPSPSLKSISPDIYNQEQQKAAAKLSEAVALAEQAFAQELKTLVSHLSEVLTPSPDGKAKVFRDSAITNFETFFERFNKLSIHSSEELDSLVSLARSIIKDTNPTDLRALPILKSDLQAEMAQLAQKLAPLTTTKKRRSILIPESNGVHHEDKMPA